VATATKRAAAKKTAPSKPSKKSSAENKQYVRKADMNSRPTGASGLKRSNGIIYEEFLTELIGQRANKIYKEMTDNDPVIGAMLFAVDSG
jgi:hypothetical protein